MSPDITMCNGEGCENKELCYRYKATPSEYQQSYFMESPFINPNYCPEYLPVTKSNKSNKLQKRCRVSKKK